MQKSRVTLTTYVHPSVTRCFINLRINFDNGFRSEGKMCKIQDATRREVEETRSYWKLFPSRCNCTASVLEFAIW